MKGWFHREHQRAQSFASFPHERTTGSEAKWEAHATGVSAGGQSFTDLQHTGSYSELEIAMSCGRLDLNVSYNVKFSMRAWRLDLARARSSISFGSSRCHNGAESTPLVVAAAADWHCEWLVAEAQIRWVWSYIQRDLHQPHQRNAGRRSSESEEPQPNLLVLGVLPLGVSLHCARLLQPGRGRESQPSWWMAPGCLWRRDVWRMVALCRAYWGYACWG